MTTTNKENNDVCVAQHNRYRCSYCDNKIEKGNYFFRNATFGFRSSHIINICKDCITKISVIAGITTEELNKKRKELIVENL